MLKKIGGVVLAVVGVMVVVSLVVSFEALIAKEMANNRLSPGTYAAADAYLDGDSLVVPLIPTGTISVNVRNVKTDYNSSLDGTYIRIDDEMIREDGWTPFFPSSVVVLLRAQKTEWDQKLASQREEIAKRYAPRDVPPPRFGYPKGK